MIKLIIAGLIGYFGGIFAMCLLSNSYINELEKRLEDEVKNNLKLEKLYKELLKGEDNE